MSTTQATAGDYRRVLADVVYDRLHAFIGDTHQGTAAISLAVWKLGEAVPDDVREMVIARFEAEREPVAGKDYLPLLPCLSCGAPTEGEFCPAHMPSIRPAVGL